MGTTTNEAGIIIAFLGTAALVLISLVATKGKNAGKVGSIVAFIFIVMFTFMEWIPAFMGSIIAFIAAVYVAQTWGYSLQGQKNTLSVQELAEDPLSAHTLAESPSRSSS